MPRIFRILFIIFAVGMPFDGHVHAQPNPQYAHGYEFTFGITSDGWVTLPDWHVMNAQDRTTPLADFGFSFWFFDHGYRTISINSQGGIRFGTRFAERYRETQTPFPSSSRNAYRWKFHTPYIMPFGMSLFQGPGSYSRWGVTGEPGQRRVVCEFNMSRTDSLPAVYRCQVQLFEADGSVLYLYQPVQDSTPAYGNTGMAYDPYHFININSNTTYASALVNLIGNDPNLATVWPQGNMRYYRLRPNRLRICANAARLCPQNVRQTTAEVTWRRNELDEYYLFSYDTIRHYDDTWETDTAGNPVAVARMTGGQPTRDTVLRLSGLRPGTAYEVRVATVCRNGDTSSPQRVYLYTYDGREADNQFDYANLYCAHVSTINGTFAAPYRYDDRYDFGPFTNKSRHTVCSNIEERDTLTRRGLLMVNPEFSHSVRLGDTTNGALSEGIIYQLDVDTLDFDLLLVSFALVEQSPYHSDPPQVTIEFLDSAGHLTDSCNRVNFLSNDLSDTWFQGVARGEFPSAITTMWKPWAKVGLDLAPFQGQRIQIRITNYDCGQGLHYGYCYYAIRSGTKHLRTSTCSSAYHTVFHSPEGFVYRWYPLGNSAQTLGTADSLVVYQPGWYCCWCGYKHNPACGFELRAYAGPRIPVAAFRVEPLDSCYRRCRFVNESYLAQDSALTPFLGLKPESYLWRFSDGTTSTEANPIHEFSEGTWRVELVAMEGNGECRDSVAQLVTVAPVEVLIEDSICIGGYYLFHDTLITNQGTYIYTLDCRREVLHLYAFKPYSEEHDDTVCRGDGIHVRDDFYDADTCLQFSIPGPFGCDSTYSIRLAVRDWPEPDIDIVQECHDGAYYTVSLTPGWHYAWHSDPADYRTTSFGDESSVRLSPSVSTAYQVDFSYPDAPYCTVAKDFRLDPLGSVTAALTASPSVLDLDHRSLVATDVSAYSQSREWFVDDVLQPDTGSMLRYDLPSDRPVDSVRLALVVHNLSCQDTARLTVPVFRYQLLFPNIITPGLPQNNRFLPSGYGISDYQLWIYDRRGVLMFHTGDIQQSWDGTSHGVDCPQGSYAYVCQYTIATGERRQQAGTVTIVR